MDPTTTDAVLAFLAAAAIAWLLVPYAERLAFRIGAIDPPKERGLHDRPMPRLSGLAIFAGIEVAGWIFLPADGETRSILLGAAAIAAVGVVDDVREPAGAAEADRPGGSRVQCGVSCSAGRGGDDPGPRRRPGRRPHPALRRRLRARLARLPADRARDRRRRQRDQLPRRGRRPRRRRLHDRRDRPGRDRPLARPQRRRRAGGADRGRRARLPPPRLPAGVELHGGHRLQPARLPARRPPRCRGR